MDAITSRLEQLETNVNVLTEENAKQKFTIRENEKLVSQHTTRIIDLECKEEVLRQQVSHLKAQLQEKQKQMDSFTNSITSIERVKKMIETRLNDMEEKTMWCGSISIDLKKQMDLLTKKITSIEYVNKTPEFCPAEQKVKFTTPVGALENLQIQSASLQENVSSIERTVKQFDSRLQLTEKKALCYDTTLKHVQKQSDSLQENVSSIEHTVKQFDSRLQLTEKKALCYDTTLKHVQKQISWNVEEIDHAKACQDTMFAAAFNVILEENEQETNPFWFWLDSCKEVFLGHSCFDARTGCFTAPADGTYFFNVTVCQTGPGKLQVSLRPIDKFKSREDDGLVVLSYIKGFWFGTASECRSGSLLMRLSQDEQIGVKVERLEGRAKVSWCRFNGCLLFV